MKRSTTKAHSQRAFEAEVATRDILSQIEVDHRDEVDEIVPVFSTKQSTTKAHFQRKVVAKVASQTVPVRSGARVCVHLNEVLSPITEADRRNEADKTIFSVFKQKAHSTKTVPSRMRVHFGMEAYLVIDDQQVLRTTATMTPAPFRMKV